MLKMRKLKFLKKKGDSVPLYVKDLYGGPKNLIKGITFRVKKRDIFAVVGLSGSGKTSLLKIILGMFMKKSGSVKFYGKSLFWSRKSIGFCPQQHSFFNELTVRENILLFGSLHGLNKKDSLAKGISLIKEMQIEDKMDTKAEFLSGGQKTRLNIILSTLHEPKILFLDEPFSGLDYYNRNLLWSFLKQTSSKGVPIILTTHLLNEAQKNCNEIFVIKKGRKFAQGDVEDIRQKVGLETVSEIEIRRMSKTKMKEMVDFCKMNSIDILSRQAYVFYFGINEKKHDKLVLFLHKRKYDYRVLVLREPELDDVFLKMVNL